MSKASAHITEMVANQKPAKSRVQRKEVKSFVPTFKPRASQQAYLSTPQHPSPLIQSPPPLMSQPPLIGYAQHEEYRRIHDYINAQLLFNASVQPNNSAYNPYNLNQQQYGLLAYMQAALNTSVSHFNNFVNLSNSDKKVVQHSGHEPTTKKVANEHQIKKTLPIPPEMVFSSSDSNYEPPKTVKKEEKSLPPPPKLYSNNDYNPTKTENRSLPPIPVNKEDKFNELSYYGISDDDNDDQEYTIISDNKIHTNQSNEMNILKTATNAIESEPTPSHADSLSMAVSSFSMNDTPKKSISDLNDDAIPLDDVHSFFTNYYLYFIKRKNF